MTPRTIHRPELATRAAGTIDGLAIFLQVQQEMCVLEMLLNRCEVRSEAETVALAAAAANQRIAGLTSRAKNEQVDMLVNNAAAVCATVNAVMLMYARSRDQRDPVILPEVEYEGAKEIVIRRVGTYLDDAMEAEWRDAS
jgi:NAD(P)-dependent dehydrogenase (short-subunit alcohol dehydrogenase family)